MKQKKIKVYMVFGEDASRAFEDYGSNLRSNEAKEEILAAFDGPDNLVVREFNTQAEVDAYFQGMADIDGWEGSIEIEKGDYLRLRKFLNKQ